MTQKINGLGEGDVRDRLFDVTHLENGLARRTGKSAIVVLLFSAFKLLLALATTAVLARLIEPGEHGKLALAMPAILVAAGLSEFGLAQAVTQRPHVTHRLASALFWVNCALGLSLSILVFAIGGAAANFYGAPEAKVIFEVLSPYVFFAVLTTQYMALLRRQMKVKVIEVCNTIATITSAVLAVGLALAGYGVEALIIQLLAVQSLTFLLLVFATRWIPSGPQVLLKERLKDILSYGGFLAAERVINDLARNLQLALVGRFFGTVDAGLYYRAEALSQMPQRRVLSPLSAAFIPALSRLQHDANELRALFRRLVSRANLIVVPIGALLTGLADVFVSILLGAEWSAAAPILSLFGVTVAVSAFQSCTVWTLVAVGDSRTLFFFRLINTTMIIALVLAAIWSGFGIVAMVAVYVVASALLGLIHLCTWAVVKGVLKREDVSVLLLETISLSCLLMFSALALRQLLCLETWIEGGIVIFAIMALTGGWGMMRAETRADILKLLKVSG